MTHFELYQDIIIDDNDDELRFTTRQPMRVICVKWYINSVL